MYYTEGMSCCAFRWTPYYNALHQWLHDVRTLCVHKKISFKYPVLIQDKTLDPPTCSTSQSMQISSSEILNEH